MPDVGLFKAAEPLDPDYRVIIKYSVEVEGLPVYQESYNVDTLAKDLEDNPGRLKDIWFRRIQCAVNSRERHGFVAALTRCLTDGQCGDFGHQAAESLDAAGLEIRK